MPIGEHPSVRLPVMICQDGFITSHALENIVLLDTDSVKAFVGEYRPEHFLLKAENPLAIGPYDLGCHYMEHKVQQAEAMKGAKKRILEVDMADTKFGADEDRMIYFFLLSSLRREHFAAVGIECGDAYHYLTDEEKMRIIDNLTAKEKALIRRDYLLANFKGAFGSNAIASLLLDFAQKHMPETLADIKSGHNEVYEKRHKRIEEKKAVLLAQEKAAQEAARPEEPQAETDGHTDAQPAEVAA